MKFIRPGALFFAPGLIFYSKFIFEAACFGRPYRGAGVREYAGCIFDRHIRDCFPAGL